MKCLQGVVWIIMGYGVAGGTLRRLDKTQETLQDMYYTMRNFARTD
jgi:hypothetical protein